MRMKKRWPTPRRAPRLHNSLATPEGLSALDTGFDSDRVGELKYVQLKTSALTTVNRSCEDWPKGWRRESMGVVESFWRVR